MGRGWVAGGGGGAMTPAMLRPRCRSEPDSVSPGRRAATRVLSRAEEYAASSRCGLTESGSRRRISRCRIRQGYAEVGRAVVAPFQHLHTRVTVRVAQRVGLHFLVRPRVVDEQVGLAVLRDREATVPGAELAVRLVRAEDRLRGFFPRL